MNTNDELYLQYVFVFLNLTNNKVLHHYDVQQQLKVQHLVRFCDPFYFI